MTDTKKILSRNEVPQQDTWAMEDLFASDLLWQQAYDEIQKEIEEIRKQPSPY